LKRSILALLAGAALLAVPAFGLAKTQTTKVKVANTSSLGKILVKGNGFTLYIFTRDSKHNNKDTCYSAHNSFGKCRDIWPPFIDKGKLIAGTGVNANKLGTIKLPNGSKQVTYYGHPLYGYSGDFGPADTSYVGQSQFGGNWYAIGPGGKAKH